MKNQILIAAAAVGMLALGACENRTPAQENTAASLEAQADNLEAMADDTSNVAASEMMENRADNLEEMADDVGGGDLTPNSTGAVNNSNAM